MNKDTLTTLLGLAVAAITAILNFQHSGDMPTWQVVLGYLAAVFAAMWGWATNKR
jgi:hypothetical protein